MHSVSRRRMCFVSSACLIALLSACSGKKSETSKPVEPKALNGVSKNAQLSFAVDQAANLPPCTGELQGQLAYSMQEKSLYSCEQAEWKALSLRGADGLPGPKGEQGAKGEQGPKGEDGAKNCKVEKLEDGAKITCGEDSVTIRNGKDGVNGKSCAVTKDGGKSTLQCGDQTVQILDGRDGRDGAKGEKGDTPRISVECKKPGEFLAGISSDGSAICQPIVRAIPESELTKNFRVMCEAAFDEKADLLAETKDGIKVFVEKLENCKQKASDLRNGDAISIAVPEVGSWIGQRADGHSVYLAAHTYDFSFLALFPNLRQIEIFTDYNNYSGEFHTISMRTSALPKESQENLRNVTELSVKGFLLAPTMQKEIANMKKLQVLEIQRTDFSKLGPVLGQLTDLKKLNLDAPRFDRADNCEHNDERMLSGFDFLQNLQKLTQLSLRCQKKFRSLTVLPVVDSNGQKVSPISEIDLRETGISALDSGERFHNVTFIDLQQTPFSETAYAKCKMGSNTPDDQISSCLRTECKLPLASACKVFWRY